MATPIVKDGLLVGTGIKVDSPDWVDWLEDNKSFRFESPKGTFTAIKKGPAQKHWYADRRKNSKLYSKYLGVPENIDTQRCLVIAKEIDDEIAAARSPQEIKIAQLEEENALLKAEVQKLRKQLKVAA